jgi:hypothetical protein
MHAINGKLVHPSKFNQMSLLACLVFNGTSTQEGQFMPTAGGETDSGN